MSRIVAHGEAWFAHEDQMKVMALMRAQSSSARAAYQAIHKHGLKGNDVNLYVKKHFMSLLNQRYISDAVSRIKGIRCESALFGGKGAWRRMLSGSISKEEWRLKRDGLLYSRGDRTKNGNPNIRVCYNKIMVNDPSGRGEWIVGSLFIPKKWKPDLSCYDVRLSVRNGKFVVVISWDAPLPKVEETIEGAVGVDCNPDGCAIVEVTGDGNIKRHFYERRQRIQFAREGKRDNDVRDLAAKVVAVAKSSKKPIVVEKLSFNDKGGKGWRKFNRMRSNFLHRKIIDAIRSRAAKEGVRFVSVNPAFSSILGNLKYARMYSLNRHDAAALVIGRRGMQFLERRDFAVTQGQERNQKPTLEGRGFRIALTEKACSWLETGFLKPKTAGLTALDLAPGSRPGIGSDAGEIPAGEPLPTTGRQGDVDKHCGRRKAPFRA